MIRRISGLVVLCGCLTAGGALQAHHSVSGTYDVRKEGEVTGVVTKIRLTNPHGTLNLDVKNKDGSTTHWIFSTGSATTLARLGLLTKDGPNYIKPGDTITAMFYPTRNGRPLGFLTKVKMPDGHVVQVASGSRP